MSFDFIHSEEERMSGRLTLFIGAHFAVLALVLSVAGHL